MQKIEKWKSSDGCEFTTRDACEQYEAFCRSVDDAMAILGPAPELAHGTFVQHDRDACVACKRAMLKIVRKRFDGSDYAIFKYSDDEIHPSSFVGRLIDDSGPLCLGRAWWRLQRINWENFCEYDQPYYANHPNEARAA